MKLDQLNDSSGNYPPAQTAWVLSEGAVGMEVQGVGLTERLGLVPKVLRISVRAPWKLLPPRLWLAPLLAPGSDGDVPEPPWPDLLVSCGRKAVAIAVEIRRRAEGRCFAIHIQDPKVPLSWFDAVIVPSHDRLALRATKRQINDKRLLIMRGSIHKITEDRLLAAADEFLPTLAHLPRPLIGVLVGASNGHYRIDQKVVEGIADALKIVHQNTGAGFVVSTSRRTPHELSTQLAERLSGLEHYYWSIESTDENPYFGILALADALLVTADSVNMTTEAAATGKPVYTIDLPGHGGKFKRFHDSMRKDGFTRPFQADEVDLSWTPPRLDEAGRIATAVKALLETEGNGSTGISSG